MTSIKGNNFWQFSLNYYPKVQPICLAWQNEFNANVNLLLFLCFLEQQHLSITTQTLTALSLVLNEYNKHITQRIRRLRIHVSSLNEQNTLQQQFRQELKQKLKKELLSVELIAEKHEQQLLVQTIVSNTPYNIFPNASSALLELYLEHLNQPLSHQTRQQVVALRQALNLCTISS